MILYKSAIILSVASIAYAIKCYSCDAIKGSDLPCDGGSNLGKQVECEDKCGLLLEKRLTYDKHYSSVVSSDYRWRRGCVTTGQELLSNSDADQNIDGELGCQKAGGRTEDKLKIEFELCLCNSTLCNEKNTSTVMLPNLFGMIFAIVAVLMYVW